MPEPCPHSTLIADLNAALRSGAEKDGAHREGIDRLDRAMDDLVARMDDLSGTIARQTAVLGAIQQSLDFAATAREQTAEQQGAILETVVVGLKDVRDSVADLTARVAAVEKNQAWRWWHAPERFIRRTWLWLVSAGGVISLVAAAFQAELHDMIVAMWHSIVGR